MSSQPVAPELTRNVGVFKADRYRLTGMDGRVTAFALALINLDWIGDALHVKLHHFEHDSCVLWLGQQTLGTTVTVQGWSAMRPIPDVPRTSWHAVRVTGSFEQSETGAFTVVRRESGVGFSVFESRPPSSEGFELGSSGSGE